ncbi:hypothetical protein EDD21DRAFT_241667 [Dissophora ornata]|nr:hypothetical protein EDD21DRAFT_241667 [Dissophora ornata]
MAFSLLPCQHQTRPGGLKRWLCRSIKRENWSQKRSMKARYTLFRYCPVSHIVNTSVKSFKSFAGSVQEYTVLGDVERSLLLSCTCSDYFRNKIPCKHMYLVARVFDIFEIRYTPDPEPDQNSVANNGDVSKGPDNMSKDYPPVPAFIPPNVRLLIHMQRAQELELRKRKHEQERLQRLSMSVM